MILSDEKSDPAVLALKEIGRRIVLMLAAGALHHAPFRRIVKSDMLVQRHTGLDQRINVCADAARLALPESEHRSVGCKETGIIIGLRFRRIARCKLWIAADVEQSTHRRSDNIRRLVVSVGPVLPKA